MSEFWAKLREDLKRGVKGKTGVVPEASWMDEADLARPEWVYARDGQGRRNRILLGYGRNAAGEIDLDLSFDRTLAPVADIRPTAARTPSDKKPGVQVIE